MTDPISLLSRALDQTGALVSRIRPDQASLPTPCPAWDLRALVNHVVYDLEQFARMARGEKWEPGHADVIGDDWAKSYRRSADALLAEWRGRGDLDEAASGLIHLQIAELAMHGWDVARATGQSTDLDPEIGRASLDWLRQNLTPQYRGPDKDFGDEVPVPAEATLYERLAAFAGRDPARWPGHPQPGGVSA
jgi:uncharacterized protein (TIGR03086 family)